jgi:membrane-associated phospholipid phosphatase
MKSAPAATARSSAPAGASPVRANPFARWAAWEGARETVRQFKLAWITIPVAAKLRFAATLGVGLFACAILTAAITLVARWWAPRGLAAWDERVLRALDAWDKFSVQQAIIAESFGNMAYMIPLVIACAVVAARRRRPLLAIAFVAAYVLARAIVWVGWLIWDRQRPDFILDGKAAPPLHSFPSGHVALALSAYGILAYLWWRASRSWLERAAAAILLVALIALTGIARVRLGTHWPSDIIAGFVIGVAWLAVVLRALHASRNAA